MPSSATTDVMGANSLAGTIAGSPAPMRPATDGQVAPAPGPIAGSGPGSATGPASLDKLQAVLAELAPVVVAFSGGADSAFLAWVATTTLGADAALCATAVSPSLAPEELADCRALAREWGLAHVEVETHELEHSGYVANGADRCFHCKSALMDALDALDPLRSGSGSSTGSANGSSQRTVVLGVNVDDLGDHRPGQQAAADRGARFPLVEAGFSKADVREWSKHLGLRTWDKPAAACLSSRLPYGTPVTLGTLSSVAAAESALRSMGLAAVRVRHYGDTARIEVPLDDLAAVVGRRDEVAARLHAAGYRYVTLDLDGLRSGNLNQALERRGVAP